jgi:protein ImuB
MWVFEQLVEQLVRQLIARDQGAVLLACVFYFVGGSPEVCDRHGAEFSTTPFAKPQGVPPQLLRVGLLQPSANSRQLLELIELHLERAKLKDEVDRVELRATVVGRLGERQGELFADCWPTDPHQLAVLVNRLGSRLGYESLLQVESRASPVPERAVKWVAVVGENNQALRQENKKSRLRSLSPPVCFPARPLVLYSKPQAVEVGGVAPDGPPQFMWLEKRRERITQCVGPERIETLWWRGPSVRRDYYRVATESDCHLWIFQRLADQQWFLHGIFE